MPFIDEVAGKLVSLNLGVIGTTLFTSSRAAIPSGTGPYISLVETGGTSPLRRHDHVALPAYQRPSMQITVRATSAVVARAKALEIYTALTGLRNVVLGTALYLEITAVQEVLDMGLDDIGRARFGFNINALKTFS